MKHIFWRGAFYCTGVAMISLGITLNTKTGLGLSAITSLPYSAANALGCSFSTALFWFYIACVVLQLALKRKKSGWRDILQLPLSAVFSAIQGWFGQVIRLDFTAFWQPYAALAAAVVFTGAGIFMMVNMDLVPAPADGVPYVIGNATGKSMGFIKNMMDGSCVLGALAIDLLFAGRVVSIGVGTIVVMLFTGRVIAVCDMLFKEKVRKQAGLL